MLKVMKAGAMKALKPLPWAKDEAHIANKYFNEKCGLLHLQWAMDHYFGLVTRNFILPASQKIYDALVAKGYSEKNKGNFNDGDDDLFFIPSSHDKKVFVHTTQNRDFLFIINKCRTKNPSDDSIHIRRIYRELELSDNSIFSTKELFGSKNKALQHAETLTEYHDDHYRFSHRPSLEAYRKVDFQIPYHPKDREKERDYYGDFRDGGYILSYDGWLGKLTHPRVEGSKYVFADLEMLSTCYIGSILDELEIDFPRLNGYR